MGLLDDLNEASHAAARSRTCALCEYIEGVEDPATKAALTGAAAGTIGERRLVEILRRYGGRVGRQTIHKHRAEGHMS